MKGLALHDRISNTHFIAQWEVKYMSLTFTRHNNEIACSAIVPARLLQGSRFIPPPIYTPSIFRRADHISWTDCWTRKPGGATFGWQDPGVHSHDRVPLSSAAKLGAAPPHPQCHSSTAAARNCLLPQQPLTSQNTPPGIISATQCWQTWSGLHRHWAPLERLWRGTRTAYNHPPTTTH